MTDKEITFLDSLYKMYNESEYNFDALNNKKIFLSKPSAFNDPFDCFVAMDEKKFICLYMAKKLKEIDAPENIIVDVKSGDISIIRYAESFNTMSKLFNVNEIEKITGLEQDIIKKMNYEKWLKESKDLLQKYRDKINEIRNSFYIACFTKNRPTGNMVMWSHYANNYKGLCAEFNFGNIKYDLGKERIDKRGYKILKHMHYVTYSRNFIKLDTDTLFNTPIDKLTENKKIISAIKRSLCKKHEQWKYEKEIRLVLTEKDLRSIGDYKILQNGCLLYFPYLRRLFIHKRINNYTIKPAVENLAKKLDIKYCILKDSNGAIVFEEDDEINDHNLLIDMKNMGLGHDNNDNIPDIPF